MTSELTFLEGLMKADANGQELQFFKNSVWQTKVDIVARILELRKQDVCSTKNETESKQ